MKESGADERKSDERTDPGAIRHGNFMNYYQFHPAEERVRQLPRGVWQRQRVAHPARKYAGLDVGCNAGVRTAAAHLSGTRLLGITPAFVIRNCKRPRLISARSYLPIPGLSKPHARHPLPEFCVLCPCQKFPAFVGTSLSLSLKSTRFFYSYTKCHATAVFPLSWIFPLLAWITQCLERVLRDFLEEAMSQDRPEVSLIGVDLDPVLIEKARERNPRPERLTFECLDFLSEDCDGMLRRYLAKLDKARFDVVFCFSITMWIHLNHGDGGLEEFLRRACELADMIVVEPQSWRCYRNASRRLRRAKLGDFPLLKEFQLVDDVDGYVHGAVIFVRK